jgi:hypothetical protein
LSAESIRQAFTFFFNCKDFFDGSGFPLSEVFTFAAFAPLFTVDAGEKSRACQKESQGQTAV